MPVKLSGLNPEIALEPIPMGESGDSLQIWIRKLTPAAVDDLRQRSKEAGDLVAGQMKAGIFPVLSRWDIEDEDGNVLPVTEETFDLLRTDTQAAIASQVQAIIFPSEETVKNDETVSETGT